MHKLTKGANAPLDCDQIYATLSWPEANGTLDVSIYLLTAGRRVRSDDDMVFFNQPADPSGAVTIEQTLPGKVVVRFNLLEVPHQIDHIDLCVTVEERGLRMAEFAGASVTVTGNGIDGISFEPDLIGASEVALRMVELYRRNGGWRIRAGGQGFNDGLAALARSYGIVVDDGDAGEPVTPSEGQANPVDATVPPVDDPAASRPEHDHDRIDEPVPLPSILSIIPEPADAAETEATEMDAKLVPGDALLLTIDHPIHEWPIGDWGADDKLTVELRWQSRLNGPIGRLQHLQLELGCYFVLDSGERAILQSWDTMGRLDRAPFIRLEEAKMVANKGHQLLTIKATKIASFRHLLLYAFIPAGSPNWASASAVMVGHLGYVRPVSVSLENGQDGDAIVAMMAVDIEEQAIKVTRHDEFAPRHPDLDAKFGWGQKWRIRNS